MRGYTYRARAVRGSAGRAAGRTDRRETVVDPGALAYYSYYGPVEQHGTRMRARARRFEVSTRFVPRLTAPAAAVIGLSGLAPAAAAQNWITESVCPDDVPAVFHRCALEAAASFEPPRTPDGSPDLGGLWRLPDGDIGGAYEDLEAHAAGLDYTGGPAAIVDPPDGEIPFRPWAEARRATHPQRYIHHNAACFLSGVPNSMYHGEERQLLQTPEYLVVLTGNAHTYRIIPLQERPPVGEDIRLWEGVSGGRWEGNTLVIETTNQNAKSWLDQSGTFYTQDVHVTERLTLVDPDTIHYQATLDDPHVFTRPFTVAFPYRRNAVEGFEMPEHACYENNEGLLGIYRTLGILPYPGISPEEARSAGEAQR